MEKKEIALNFKQHNDRSQDLASKICFPFGTSFLLVLVLSLNDIFFYILDFAKLVHLGVIDLCPEKHELLLNFIQNARTYLTIVVEGTFSVRP